MANIIIGRALLDHLHAHKALNLIAENSPYGENFPGVAQVALQHFPAVPEAAAMWRAYRHDPGHRLHGEKLGDISQDVIDEVVIDFCPDCGVAMWQGEQDYVSEYPNGSDLAREQASRYHRSHECPCGQDIEVKCPHCGEVVGEWDEEYVHDCPTGYDMAVEQAMEEHRRECPAEWQEWLTECRKAVPGLTIPGDVTPRGLLRLLLETDNQIYMKDIPCPPDRGPNHYWPEGDLVGIVDTAKTRRRLEDRLRKDEVEVMEVALSLGVAMELKGSAV